MKVEKRRTGRMILGIASLAAGVSVAVVGLEFILIAQVDSNSPYLSNPSTDDAFRVFGTTCVILGSALATVGGIYGLSTIGHTQVTPVDSERSSSRESLRLTGFGVAPGPNRGLVAGATFSF